MPVVPASSYVIRDDTMNRPVEECVTLKANYKNTNAYTANSAVCSHKKAVFCKIPKRLTTTEAATTTAPIILSTITPIIPGDNLPKMPRFCPPKRKKRNAISGMYIAYYVQLSHSNFMSLINGQRIRILKF